MTAAAKRLMRERGDNAHVVEFGECVGVVECLTDYNNCKPGEPGYDVAKVGPEVDVRWQPSNLRYGYDTKALESHVSDCAVVDVFGRIVCGGTYTCPRCEHEFGWCIGAADDTPALCDDCAMAIQWAP
jgi:hypothetical protein